MSRLERLRSLVNQRINAAADDIGRMLEGKIQEYEEEVRFFREENNSLQQKLLQFAAKPDVQVVVLSEDDSSDEQEEPPPEHSDPDPAPAQGPNPATLRPKAEGKDNETPATGSAMEESTDDRQQSRKRSKRRAPQTNAVKAKKSKN